MLFVVQTVNQSKHFVFKYTVGACRVRRAEGEVVK